MKATTNNYQKHCFTKSLWMFVVLCSTLLGSTTYGQAKTNPQEGIEFKEVIERYNNGIVKKGFFAKNTTITNHGIPYPFAAYKYIYFYESGKVKRGWLAKDTTVTIHDIPYTFAATLIDFYESGKVKEGELAKDTTITTHGIPYTFDGGWSIEFYESGKVEKRKISTGNNHHHPTASPIPLILLLASMRVARSNMYI